MSDDEETRPSAGEAFASPQEAQDAPRWENPEGYARMRAVLARADYTQAGVDAALGAHGVHGVEASNEARWLRDTRQVSPLHTLLRLFLLGVPVEAQAATQALEPMTLTEWVEAGLLCRTAGDQVAAKVHLMPLNDLMLAYDFARPGAEGMRVDHVMGVGSSSLTLANLTVRRPCRAALDLGTGCGVQAFLTAAHSERVTALDRNPRAIRIATFNAQLNDLGNVSCLEGDLFAPVQGRTFDLVVANPPFVISPTRDYIYRDSGLPADQICRRIVREVPALLEEGGYCQILCNWAHVAGQNWRERLLEWFQGIGCDAWVLRCETHDAATYATTWIQHTERRPEREQARQFDAWMDYYEAERIEAVSAGVIALRKRTGSENWFRAEDGPPRMLGPSGDYVDRCFRLGDFLDTMEDPARLLDQPLCVSPDVLLETRLAPAADGWTVDASRLRLMRGMAYEETLSPEMATLVAQSRAGLKPNALLEKPGSAPPEFVAELRRLIARGFLLPVAEKEAG